jgi:hypothetical protein
MLVSEWRSVRTQWSLRLSFAKVVGLRLIWIRTKPLPVDLVKVVRLHDETADYACSRRGLQNHFDFAEHDVPLRSELWCITRLGDGEGDAVFAICGVRLRRKAIGC